MRAILCGQCSNAKRHKIARKLRTCCECRRVVCQHVGKLTFRRGVQVSVCDTCDKQPKKPVPDWWFKKT